MADTILSKLADPNECSIKLRREFLQVHSQKAIKQKKLEHSYSQDNHLQLFQDIYQHYDGIIFGEKHFNDVSINFIANNIEYLAQLGVETLFFEGLFFGIERGIDGKRNIIDSAHPEYSPIIEAAENNNINIIGIDAAGCKRGEGITRDIFMNIYAQAIINNMDKKGKWIALVGMMHLNDSHYINPVSLEKHIVRGLSELTGGVSIILDTSGKKYIKQAQNFYALPTKRVAADFIIGLENIHKPPNEHLDNPILDLALETNATISYYDIDSHARTYNNAPQKGLIFALRFNDLLQLNLESLKYDIKTYVDLQDAEWLDIVTSNSEIIISCNYDMAGKLSQAIAKLIKHDN